MNVQILNVTVSTKTGKNGKNFQNAEVAFKNFDSGKVESKNITQYSKIFKQIVESSPGSTLDVFTEKNENGFWEWTSIKRVVMDEAVKASIVVGDIPKAGVTTSTPVRASTYETAEERAKKQAYIVKQSSLANAVALLSIGAKSPPKLDEVLSTAQRLVDFVFDDSLPVDTDIVEVE